MGSGNSGNFSGTSGAAAAAEASTKTASQSYEGADIPGNWEGHFTKADGFSRDKGVKGAHTEEAFEQYFKDNNWAYKQVDSVSHPTIDGIRDIKYQVQNRDAKLNLIEGQYRAKKYEKTLVDSTKISMDKMKKWINEARNNGTIKPIKNNNFKFEGTAKNGLKFEGWLNAKGEFDSIYPILQSMGLL